MSPRQRGRVLALGRTAEDQLRRDLREVGHLRELVLLGGGLGDVEAVDVDGRRRPARDDVGALELGLQRLVGLGRVPRRRAAQVGEERALVVGVTVEVAVLERLVDDLRRAQVVLERDVVALVLERLTVGLRDGLGPREVLRAHGERLGLGRRDAAGGKAHHEGEHAGREQRPRTAGTSVDHAKSPSLSGKSRLPTPRTCRRNVSERVGFCPVGPGVDQSAGPVVGARRSVASSRTLIRPSVRMPGDVNARCTSASDQLDRDGEQRDEEATGEDLDVVVHREAVDDVAAETHPRRRRPRASRSPPPRPRPCARRPSPAAARSAARPARAPGGRSCPSPAPPRGSRRRRWPCRRRRWRASAGPRGRTWR